MTHDLIRKLCGQKLYLLGAAWLLLLTLPWADWLEAVPWARMGIALLVFVGPGIVLSLLLVGRRLTLPAHLTSGLAISVFLVGALGFAGRVFQMPFDLIKPFFGLIGLGSLFLLERRSRTVPQLYKPESLHLPSLVLLLSMTVFGALTYFQTQIQGDHFSYLAYLTNWQHAQPLSFNDVVFLNGGLDSVRFWLAMFPMNLAFLAEISHLHGLLLFAFYLEPFLVGFALLAAYNLYEDLLESQSRAITAVLLQFTLLLLVTRGRGAGSAFFYRLCEDKAFAAFVLFPIFFLAVRSFLDSSTLRTALFMLLIGLGLMLTHPIILSYSIFICGIYALILTLNAREFRKLVWFVFLMVLVLLPAASLRVVGVPWVSRNIFGLESPLEQPGRFDLESAVNTGAAEEIISYIPGSRFYGLNLEVMQIPIVNSNPGSLLHIVLSWALLWILGLGCLWSLFNLRKHVSAPFILAATFLLLLSAIPYTGWLVGKFVSARMLWRVPWLMPTGLTGVLLLGELFKLGSSRSLTLIGDGRRTEMVFQGLIVALCLALIAYFSFGVYGSRWSAVSRLGRYRTTLENLSVLGDYLEQQVSQPSVFVAAPPLRDFIPGLSSKTKAVYFRGPNFSPDGVDPAKLSLIFSTDEPISIKQRLAILRRYKIRYVLTAEESLADYYAAQSGFSNPRNIAGYWIIECLESGR